MIKAKKYVVILLTCILTFMSSVLSFQTCAENLKPSVGSLEEPKSESSVNKTITVKGWFLDANGVSKIEVLVDGSVKGCASYGQQREDIFNLNPSYNNHFSGFKYSLDTTKLSNGQHIIKIRETSKTGAKTTIGGQYYKRI